MSDSSHAFTGAEVPAYHIAGCGAVAFYFLHHPDEGMELRPESVVYADGTRPPDQTKAVCGHCQEVLAVTDLTVRRPVS